MTQNRSKTRKNVKKQLKNAKKRSKTVKNGSKKLKNRQKWLKNTQKWPKNSQKKLSFPKNYGTRLWVRKLVQKNYGTRLRNREIPRSQPSKPALKTLLLAHYLLIFTSFSVCFASTFTYFFLSFYY